MTPASICPPAPSQRRQADGAFLPSEDSVEFKELHRQLVAEWRPFGPTEQECVYSLTRHMLIKRGLPVLWQSLWHAECEYASEDPRRQEVSSTALSEKANVTPDAISTLVNKLRSEIQNTAQGEGEMKFHDPAVNGPSDQKAACMRKPRRNRQADSMRAVAEQLRFMTELLKIEALIDKLIDGLLERLARLKRIDEVVQQVTKAIAQPKGLVN
jgi:hypothetical protein